MNLPDTISRPVLITSAVVAGLGPLVGNALYAGPDASGAELQVGLADKPAVAYAGYTLELVGFVAMATVFAVLCTWLARRSPVAACVTGIAGAAALAVKVGSVTPTMAVAAADDPLDPATVDTLVAIGDMAFIIFGFLTCVAFTAAGLGLLRTEAPRWLGWWATVAGVLGVVAAGVGVLEPDAYVFVPFLTLLLWLVALGLTEAFGRSGVVNHAVGAVPVPE
jgi:Domain of unknown function (DUF4386)